MNPMLAKLKEMREFDGTVRTTGLPDAAIERFLAADAELTQAIDEAYAAHLALRSCMPEFLHLDESEQIRQAQTAPWRAQDREPGDAIHRLQQRARQGPQVFDHRPARQAVEIDVQLSCQLDIVTRHPAVDVARKWIGQQRVESAEELRSGL